jgi:hypothetical protein
VLLEVVAALHHGGAIVGRYGGDEFMVALLNADQTEAETYKAGVDALLQRAHVVDPETGATVPVVASTGIAWYPEDGATLPALVETADNRMYEEKAKRRVSTGLSSSRTFADDRIARLAGEVMVLFTGPGTLEEQFRLAAHRITLGGGYAAASFSIVDDDADGEPISNTGAFGRASEELLEAWNEEARKPSPSPVRDIVAVTRQPFIIDEIATSEHVTEEQRRVLGVVGIKSGIVVPLFARDELFALLSVGKNDVGAFTEADAQFLGEVARHIAGVVDLARRAAVQDGAAGGPGEARAAA